MTIYVFPEQEGLREEEEEEEGKEAGPESGLDEGSEEGAAEPPPPDPVGDEVPELSAAMAAFARSSSPNVLKIIVNERREGYKGRRWISEIEVEPARRPLRGRELCRECV